MQFMQLPAIQAPQNALIDFSGLNSAMGDYSKALERQYGFQTAQQAGAQAAAGNMQGAYATAMQRGDPELAMKIRSDATQQQLAQLQNEKAAAALYGAAAARVVDERDTTRQAAMMQRIYASHPEFAGRLKQYGIDPNDHTSAARFIMDQALGIGGGIEQQAMRAKIGLTAAETAKASEEARSLKLGTDVGAPVVEDMMRNRQPPAPNARRAQDGKWYVPDPSRPGKYMQWVP